MTTRLVSLGDSFSCGQGVGLSVPPASTWPALLARALPRCEHTPLAVAGSRVRDVRRGQLPAALAARPTVATVLIGLNDVCRSDFDPKSFRTDLTAVTGELRAAGARVLLGRLHDPCRQLPVPARLARTVRDRLSVANAAVDALAGLPGVHAFDLAAVPALRLRAAWSVDRVHPTAVAHVHVATAAARALRSAGVRLRVPEAPPVQVAAPTTGATAWWLARHGLPWVATHLRDVAVPTARAAVLGDQPRGRRVSSSCF